MFYDRAKIEARAGRGGNGSVSFRREKHVARGGPDGGDGGDGGDVILQATQRLRDLAFFQKQRHFRAGNGRSGEGSRKNGQQGRDLRVEVPCGTQVLDDKGALIADLVRDGQYFTAARGGAGGRGNARFASSTRRSPRFAELGLAGSETVLSLELKLLADAGLLGFPNAGKSSLLRRISNARPRVAEYPFTTKAPMLGTVEDTESHQQYTVADIPGLLEGASQGVGLGDKFLVHLERTSLLIHLVDVNGYYDREPLDNFNTINRELLDFSAGLAARAQIVAVNKTDLVEDKRVIEVTTSLEREVEARCRRGDPVFAWLLEEAGGDPDEINPGSAVIPISAATGKGTGELLRKTFSLLKEAWKLQEPVTDETPEGHITYRPGEEDRWQVAPSEGYFVVRGSIIERIVAQTDFSNDEAILYMQERLEQLGVSDELRRAGAKTGDDVVIGDMEFEFW